MQFRELPADTTAESYESCGLGQLLLSVKFCCFPLMDCAYLQDESINCLIRLKAWYDIRRLCILKKTGLKMVKLVLSLDGVVIREVVLDRDHMSLGRRPYNHIVIDNMAVSGEHAIFQYVNGAFFVEDLNSTNGTLVNGIKVRRQQLKHGDIIGVAKFRIQFHVQQDELNTPPKVTGVLDSVIEVLSGSYAGRIVKLSKPVTTLGKPGVAVASISRRGEKFVLRYIEGSRPLTCNDHVVAGREHVLAEGDLINLAGVQMLFTRQTSE